jgi:hypothetical protein
MYLAYFRPIWIRRSMINLGWLIWKLPWLLPAHGCRALSPRDSTPCFLICLCLIPYRSLSGSFSFFLCFCFFASSSSSFSPIFLYSFPALFLSIFIPLLLHSYLSSCRCIFYRKYWPLHREASLSRDVSIVASRCLNHVCCYLAANQTACPLL